MNRLLIACLLLAVITGCSRSPESGSINPSTPAATASADGARRTLAYRHAIQIDAAEDKVATIHAAALAACHDAAADLCTVLESRISTGRQASASLRLRARPSGIQKLIAAMSRQAAITDQSTQAEDLAGPIQDGEKKLALLTAYRADLEALRQRAGKDVDALIKVTHELSSVQSELESTTGKQAALTQRVETETLDIAIHAERSLSFWRPVSLALSDFGSSLSQGVATAITGVAYLLPWSLVIGLAVWIVRKLWRRRRLR
jgi:hypothetical protein